MMSLFPRTLFATVVAAWLIKLSFDWIQQGATVRGYLGLIVAALTLITLIRSKISSARSISR